MNITRYVAIGALALVGLGACASKADEVTAIRPSTEEPTTEAPTTEEPTTTTEAPTETTTTEAPTTTTTAPPTTTTTENPELSNARESAQQYLDYSGFSRQGLIDQLSSEYGDQYPVEVATAAVDSLRVDWNAEAVEAAESYLEFQAFSHAGLVDQLSSEYGDQFTREQAEYGARAALGE
jgi:host cell surface-exposed lipoprotein